MATKKKEAVVDREGARRVSKLIHSEFNKMRDTLKLSVDERVKLYEEFLLAHPDIKGRRKAESTLRAVLKNIKKHLRMEIRLVLPEFRDLCAEVVVDKEFKLMTIAGRVSAKGFARRHGKKK
jgi:hypothetical protein